VCVETAELIPINFLKLAEKAAGVQEILDDLVKLELLMEKNYIKKRRLLLNNSI